MSKYKNVKFTNVTITWAAFGKPTEANIVVTHSGLSDEAICGEVFKQTNLYEGRLWEVLQDRLPADRTHTALSVGDYVEVDGNVYRCEPIGWSAVEPELN